MINCISQSRIISVINALNHFTLNCLITKMRSTDIKNIHKYGRRTEKLRYIFCVYSKTEYYQKHYSMSQHVLWAVLAFPLHVTIIQALADLNKYSYKPTRNTMLCQKKKSALYRPPKFNTVTDWRGVRLLTRCCWRCPSSGMTPCKVTHSNYVSDKGSAAIVFTFWIFRPQKVTTKVGTNLRATSQWRS